MKTKTTDIIMQNKIFGYLALGTGLILSIPLIAMQFTSEVDWGREDFIVMGVLLFGMSSLFVAVARILPRNYRTLAAIICAGTVLWLWAELAVGIFTNWGS